MESLDNIREASLTEINLSIIKQFEALVNSYYSTVKDYKELATVCLISNLIKDKNMAIKDLVVVMDKLMEGQAEFVMYLRREILESNQQSLEIGRLNRKIKLLESTSLN